jgi:hypothetical protein
MAFLLAMGEPNRAPPSVGAKEQASCVVGTGEQCLDFSWYSKVCGTIGILAKAWFDEVSEQIREDCQDKEEAQNDENHLAMEP